MKRNYKQKIIQIFTTLILLVVVFGFSVSTIAFALIPNWTQESKFSCFPSETPTKPIPAFIEGLRKND